VPVKAGQKTAPDQCHCVNLPLATREPSTEDVKGVWIGGQTDEKHATGALVQEASGARGALAEASLKAGHVSDLTWIKTVLGF
jgi:hypothetical protein